MNILFFSGSVIKKMLASLCHHLYPASTQCRSTIRPGCLLLDHARIQDFFIRGGGGGGGGSRPDSQKTVWTTFYFYFFFAPQLILQFIEGVQWFITEKTILFQGFRGVQGGVQLYSRGGGVQMLISIPI